ncbi:hypothetical protein [Chromobacterium vaccinii]|uniref:hypothetical protein n=1 Tax=Chromobacterium vaccinii TaxID=1108595 RepID=UPI000A884AAC|nr:hypothetical protein [Chromobacterium vaccinii]
MSIDVHDYIPVSEKLKEFGIATPCKLSFLPSNLEKAMTIGELRQYVESDTVRTILRKNKIPYEEIFSEDEQPLYLQQYSFEWFGPCIFIPAGLLIQDPNLLSITINLISSFLYDLFKNSSDGQASLDVILEQADGSCKKIHYSGPADGLSKIPDIVKELESKK